MKWPSVYLKMMFLGAVQNAFGNTLEQRIKNAAEQVFIDEDGNRRKFTWRTISTWYYRYKNYGVTGMDIKNRADKGKTRKVSPEQLLEAINQVLPSFAGKRFNKSDIYRLCIEKQLIDKQQLAPTTFYRFIREYDLLDNNEAQSKKRLAFAMAHANSFISVRYEPSANLQNKKITIRFERSDPADIIVYYKNQRIGKARRLNLIANSKIKRGARS